MIKNYITVAVRHFFKNRLFSVINVLCLSIGITFSVVIALYVWSQEGVNSNLSDVQQQFLLKSIYKQKDQGLDLVSISPLAKAAKETYPALVDNYYRYNPVTNVVSAGENHFKEDIAIGDTTLVSMFGFPLVHGDKNRAFLNNNSAVITERFALKMYGTSDAIGKPLSVQTTVASVADVYTITAVLKDLPYNSVTNAVGDQYSVYIPATGNNYFGFGDFTTSWDNTNMVSFLKLKPGVRATTVEPLLNGLLKKNSSDFVWKNLSAGLFSLKDYYLNDNDGAVKKMVLILSLIAIFILLMVIINFVNINIGTSANRLKEIGLRKTFGSLRPQVMLQFVVESLIITFVAGAISVLLYQFVAPYFGRVLNASLPSLAQLSLLQYAILVALVAVIGLLAGIYPAFVLSSTNLINAVKGKVDSTTGNVTFKRALLVVQFSLAIFVFICALNLSRQVSYIFGKDLGYNKDQLLVVSAFPKQWDAAGVAKMNSIKHDLMKLPGVKDASLVFDLPDNIPYGRFVLYPVKRAATESQLNLPVASADEDYVKTMGIQLLAGSFFADNKTGIVLNETAVKQLGLTIENAVGRQVTTAAQPVTVTGVIKDFNFSSLQNTIGPIGFVHVNTNNIYRYLLVKLNPADIGQTLQQLKARWHSFAPDAPFDYTFMDEKFAALYKSELQLQAAANLATLLNIIIVVLGIVGVVTFMISKKNKEIAVRKVLGANARTIIMLFLKEYAGLIIIANVIAWPAAYIITEKLLQNFAYRIQQNAGPYLLVLLSISLMTALLICLQTFKAAIANPVRSLRSE